MIRITLTAIACAATLTACTSTELVQSANTLALAGAILSVPEAQARGIDIPPGHLPPPGTCKVCL